MITNKFIHIHIPRTAGQFVRGIFRRKASNWAFLVKDSHLTLSDSRAILRSKNPRIADSVPSFCVVRNPWDWYVSRYFFRQTEWRRQNKTVSFSDIENFENSKKGFQEHLIFTKNLIDSGGKAKSLIQTNVARIWQRLTISTFFNELTEHKVDYIGKFESLAADLSRILSTIDPKAFKPREVRAFTRSKVNSSKHASYQNYYNEELRDMVYEWDKEYIERFGYEF